MNPDLIPLELRSLPQWVLWRAEDRGGKTTKIPYTALGDPASVSDPGTWCFFDAAAQVAPQFSGFGFVLTEGGGLACIDVDHAISPEGVVSPWALDLVESFDSFVELSSSGSGLHLWFQISESLPGRKFSAKRLREAGFDAQDGEALEVYTQGRYLTVTGKPFQRYRPLRSCDTELQSLLRKLSPPATQTAHHPPCVVDSSRDVTDDYSILQKAFESKKGPEIQALWNGDISGAQSHSEADLALCGHLAFWLDRDPARIDSMFRRSGLMRAKWDSLRGATAYGSSTIEKAIAGCTETYSGPSNGVPKRSRVERAGRFSDTEEPGEAIEREAISYQPFPVSTLPEPLRGFVEASALSLSVHPEWLVIPILCSIGSAWGGGIQIKPGHVEPAVLWFAGIGPPSSAKSPSLKASLEPVRRLDSDLHKKREAAFEEYRRDCDRFVSRQKKEFAERPAKPSVPQILLGSVTAEAAVLVCESNHRIPLLHTDELSGFFNSFNSYRSGKGADCEFWLSAFSGHPFSVNRVSRDPVHLPSLKISIAGFTTHSGFRACLGEGLESLITRGMLGRFIVSAPPHRERTYSEAEVDERLIGKVEALIRNLWDGPPSTLTLTPGAKALWVDYFNGLQKKSARAPEALAFFLAKLAGTVARIAGILCVARGGSIVTEEDMSCALKIGAWVENETIRAYDLLGVCRPPVDSVLMEFLTTHPGATVRDISRIGPRSLRKAGSDEIETRLRGMKGSGLVRSEFSSGAGRPGERWYVVDREEEPAELPEPGDDGLDTEEDAFESLLDLDPPPSDCLPEIAAEEVLDSEAIAALRRRFTGSSI